MNPTVLLLLKATVLLSLAFAAVRWERSAPAARRHGVWSTTFLALLALPLLALILPGLHVPVPSWRPAEVPLVSRQSNVVDDAASVETISPAPVTGDVRNPVSVPVTPRVSLPSFSAAQVLIAIWLAGVGASLIALLRSLHRVHHLAATGVRADDRVLLYAADRIARRLGLETTPQLVVSNDVSAPMAGNIGRPIVFLPADAPYWDTERREVVLTHEMTHLLRRDPLRIIAARVACALYWFHPMMWIAARRSSADCEQACDESVLALGIRPSTYARVLLDFAHRSPAPVLSVALPIVQRHRLETRVMAILSNNDASTRRAASTKRTILTTLAAIGMVVTVAAARPATVEAEVSVTQLAPVTVSVSDVPETEVLAVEARVPAAAPVVGEPVTTVQPSAVRQGGSCWNSWSRNRSFNGSSSMTGDRVTQRIGRSGNERIAQSTFGDLRVCMTTDGYSDSDRSDQSPPSEWIGRSDFVVIETDRDNDVRRLEIDRGRSSYSVNGRSVSMDDGVTTWRRAVLDLLDATWEASNLRGRESSLRGEISSVRGERSSLLGEISSLRGEVSSMMGEISSLRGEESSMRGEISSIRGHESSLRGQISSERGAISSLESQRWDRYSDRAAIDARIRRHEDNIREIEREIERYDASGKVRAVERRMADFDVDKMVAEVERRLRNFDVERKVAAVQRELDGLNVDRQVGRIENEIGDLNVESRLREINRRRDAALDRLRGIVGGR